MEKTLPFRAKRKQVQQKSFKFGKRQTTVKDAMWWLSDAGKQSSTKHMMECSNAYDRRFRLDRDEALKSFVNSPFVPPDDGVKDKEQNGDINDNDDLHPRTLNDQVEWAELASGVTESPVNHERVKTIGNHMGTTDHFDKVIKLCDRKANIAVIDPPWENKSVERGRKTPSCSSPKAAASLGIDISIYKLLDEDGSSLVGPLDSTYRRPFEPILVCWYGPNPPQGVTSRTVKCPPLCHSRKPNIEGMFSDIITPKLGVEFFARTLRPNWISWGNEVVKFQAAPFVNFYPKT